MITCPSCQSQLPETSRFCAACGNPVSAPADAATVAMPGLETTPLSASPPGGSPSAPSPRLYSTTLPRAGRFVPGTILSGRYQILGLLGRGGMGEVYRAIDLTLDQEVALKFLPEGMASNASMLARFHSEVRIARQVSHPNVCRVHDIGEVEGHLFLSMEYVDGEDLGSLLRRIGRLPSDKAIEFARKICAGLAAAHEKGVLHRDLKPANIMIDSRGRVVIMDFGLAAVANQVHGQEIRAGTPAYMSPEQLTGHEVTVRSDIYSLGLVLYEMFTGKRPYEGKDVAELLELQRESQPITMTSLVKDIDPGVESVIARCLSPDPKGRPASTLAVAAALPGGDPLAAALAAGETPSPDLVAASAGQVIGMRPGWAVACAAAAVVGLVSMAILSPMVRWIGHVNLELPPDALTLRAREIAQSLGYKDRPVDWARGFIYDHDYIRFVERKHAADKRSYLSSSHPQAIVFWYRQSPRYLEPLGDRETVGMANPPETLSGMVGEQLDARGRLLAFTAIPPQVDKSPPVAVPLDWKPLFEAAGLDLSKFKESPPVWTPLAIADARVAWDGVWPEMPDQPLHVEGAAWRGRPVYFDLIGPWTRPARMEQVKRSTGDRIVQFAVLSLAVGMLAGAALLARYNWTRGRGDRRGSMRLASAGFAISITMWILGGTHAPTAGEVIRLFAAISFSLLLGAFLWIGYMALEPYVRRHWPAAIVSWTRLMAGGIRDPLVGRDVLIGVVAGLFWVTIWAVSVLAEMKTGGLSAQGSLQSILGTRQTLAALLGVVPGSVIQMFATFFVLFVVRLILRTEWLAAAGFVIVFLLIDVANSSDRLLDAVFSIVVFSTMYLVITKFGFVSFAVSVYVYAMLTLIPLTTDFSAWYSGAGLCAGLVVIGLVIYGAHSALAGRSIIQDELL
jgi:predicted Ser/Thr protein kinase